jgi:hypothetical protein
MHTPQRWMGGLMLALVPVLAWAARPLETEDPGTIRPGKAALEVSVEYGKSNGGTVTGGAGVVGIGLRPGLEARLRATLLWSTPLHEPSRGGSGDSLLGVKHRLLNETEAPDVAVLRVGAVYPLSRRIKLDGALGWGVTRASPGVLLIVGVTIALF